MSRDPESRSPVESSRSRGGRSRETADDEAVRRPTRSGSAGARAAAHAHVGDGRDPLERLDPASLPRVRWRSEVSGASGTALLAGLWLLLSPFLLSYRGADPAVVDAALGALMILVAVLRLTALRGQAWPSWVNVALGLWLVTSGLLIADSAVARCNEVVVGGLLVLVATLSGGATLTARRRARRS
jgi:hypothetical protein